uniref:Uncharacterized protein n=1 Tax=Electrophorus electricus TaxID=8005 RepID=A0AAY5F151_ELEEL
MYVTNFDMSFSCVTQVEVDGVLGLMRDIAAEVPSHNAILFHGLGGALNRVLPHVLGHVSILDHSLFVGHGHGVAQNDCSTV